MTAALLKRLYYLSIEQGIDPFDAMQSWFDGELRIAALRNARDKTEMTPGKRETDFLTLREAADICRFKTVCPIRNAIRRRELYALKMKHRHILIPRDALDRWMTRHRMVSLSARLARAKKPEGEK
jgi:Helix-turn-helix domain